MMVDLLIVGLLGLLVGGLVVRILAGGARCARETEKPERAERVALWVYRLCRGPNLLLALAVVTGAVTCAGIGARWLRVVCGAMELGILVLGWAYARDYQKELEARGEEGDRGR